MLDFKIPKLVIKTLNALHEKGFEAYIVGGALRDIMLKIPTYDWDFTTNAKPNEIQKVFPESFYDNKFGTVGITAEELVLQFKLKNYDFEKEEIKPGDVFEITTYRSEEGYSDGRHPDKVVWGKTLKQDLKRRDFTINAMALFKKPLKSQNKPAWEIIDPFDGQKDIQLKLIRAVGDPDQRFSEDGLRMIRAIRIAAQLGFSIEEKTLKSISINSIKIQKISIERIRDEFLKILKSNYPADGVKLMFTSGLLKIIVPELIKMRGIEQAGHHTKDVWNHSLDALAECPSPDPIIRLATLMHDIGKPVAFRNIAGQITFYGHEVVGARIVKTIAERLKLAKKDKEKLWLLVRYHMFAYDSKMTDKAIRKFIKRVGKENINNMISLRIGDRKGGGSKATSWRLRELQQRIGKLMYTPLQVGDLKVSGHDVMKILNLKPGPDVGKILNTLFDEVMEDASKNKKGYLLNRIKKLKTKEKLNVKKTKKIKK
ncbi:CCA tRNA nucleotidyltransferase [Patescibacteria group bacterium]